MLRKLLLSLALCGTPLTSAQANLARVVSPEVLPDHRVTFRLRAPLATEVTVSGDFWLQQNRVDKLTKGEDGVWSLTTAPLPSNFYSYAFKLDGVPLPDPANGLTKPGVAETQSAFFVPGPAASLLMASGVPHGEVRTVYYPSALAGGTRPMHVYLPPGYERGKASYPVLYLLHGGGDDDSTWQSVGHANFLLDNLIAQGSAKPMIVVLPALWVLDPPLQPAQRAQNETLFAQSLTREIMPYVEANYRIQPGIANRAIGGLGDGRNFLPTLAWKTLGQFGSLLFVSGGSDAEHFEALRKSYPGVIEDKANVTKVHFYIGDGTNDASFAVAKGFAATLTALGYKVDFWESDHTHGWPEFRYNFAQFVRAAFR